MHRAIVSLGALLWLTCAVAGDKAAAGADPADVSVRLGSAWLDRGEYDLAIGEYDKALKVNPRSANALASRGMAHQWKDERLLAREDLDKAAAIDPRNPVVPRARGMLALRAGNLAEAAADFGDSLALQPDNVFSLRWRAETYRQSGEYDKALADSAAAIKLQPSFLGEYSFRARVLRQKGNSAEGLREAEAVAAANPDNSDAYILAAEIYQSSGKDAQAMQLLERSLTIAPTIRAYLTRAAYRPKADLAGRRADAESALALDFGSMAARVVLADAQSDAKEYEGALATLEKAMAIHGETPQLLTARGIVHERSGQPAIATADFAAARNKGTGPSELNRLCWTLATAGVALDVALSACDAAVAQLPHQAAFLDSRGLVLLRMGRYDEAIAAYDAALKARAEQDTSLYGRGVARRLKGDTVGGDADLKAALVVNAHLATTFADYGVKP
jgi:tetratricopeptide (TPR) repeat protein